MFESLLSEEGMEYKLEPQGKHQSQQQQSSQHQKRTSFPKRWLLSFLLIVLTSFEVGLVVRSQVYLHSDLLRIFLTFYADNDLYPELFAGEAFYLNLNRIQQLQQHLDYIFDTIATADNQTLISMDYSKAEISLQVQFQSQNQPYKQTNIFPIDPQIGITQPFDVHNITQIQLFLLQTNYFQIVISNLQVQNDGLFQRYVHKIIYHFEQSYQININFSFEISNSLVSNIEIDRPQGRFLILLRSLYLIILALASACFYLHLNYIRHSFQQLYNLLQHKTANKTSFTDHYQAGEELTTEELRDITTNIEANIEARNITANNLQWRHYVDIIEVDVFLTLLANILQITGNFLLFFGREHEIIIGVSCLFAWISIFQQLKSYQGIILMYQLLKISLMAVLQFLVAFFIVLMGYTFLGMCLFARSRFFFTLSRAVTTLVSMMAGDSICEITTAMREKASTTLVIIYVFSYIIIFMHAIHNTLISILKEYFILKKIQMLKRKKKQRGEEEVVYLEECRRQIDLEIKKYPVKLSQKLLKEIQVLKMKRPFEKYNKGVRHLLQRMDTCLVKQKWLVYDAELKDHTVCLGMFKRRLQKMLSLTEGGQE